MMNSNVLKLEEADFEDMVYEDNEPAETSQAPLEETPLDRLSESDKDIEVISEICQASEAPELHFSNSDQEDIVSDEEMISPTETDEPLPTEILDELINELPSNFPSALPEIREKIVPILMNIGGGLYDHYIQLLKTKTKASTKKAVQLEIEDEIARRKLEEQKTDFVFQPGAGPGPDPEIIAKVEEIKNDPLAFRKRMDLVGTLGIVGERRAIGVHFVTLDSRLIPKDGRKSEALAAKCSGPHGTGKSFPLLTCLSVYPESAYHLITNASSKSLYSIENGLKHKALVLVEALALERNNNGDNELAYSIRTLVSEGDLNYQYMGYEDKVRKTIKVRIPGPTSLLTTTVQGRLETQLEDRMITVHPDISTDQTRSILQVSTMRASGELTPVDSKEIEAWKIFHECLDPIDVVIPFAGKIAEQLVKIGDLPTSIHRAFGRVLSSIKSVAIFYQCQREKDGLGRIVAEMSDYAIARQLINEPFLESIGLRNSYTERRVQVIKQKGPIALKDLAQIESVSVPTLTPWVKERVEKGILTWCAADGQVFQDASSLGKAKRSGKAFIRMSQAGELPTPFELTGDEKWKEGGEFCEMYDLDVKQNLVDTEVIVPEEREGVRALGQNDGPKESVDVRKETDGILTIPEVPTKTVDLAEEFREVLSASRKPAEVQSGILTI